MRVLSFSLGILISLSGANGALAQQRAAIDGTDHSMAVPRLIKYGDTLKDNLGAARQGTVGLRLAIYAERTGGAALWQEVQNVTVDEQGRYSVLLGAETRDGLPADLFASGEPRWLGVQVQLPGEEEQPRVLLVSVPYAMKAADADTLGGRSAAEYVLREQLTGWSGVLTQAAPPAGQASTSTGTQALVSGTVNFLGKFTPTGSDIGNSQVFDNGTGVGIGTTNPQGLLDVQLNTSTARDTMDAQMTLNNSAAITNAVITALRMTLLDQSTGTNLSKQAMRATYIRSGAATGGVSAFDSVFTMSSFFDNSAPYQFRVLNIEGPRVASGKTLDTLIGLYLEAPPALGGTITNKLAMVTEPGAGNVGINTTSPSQLLEVSGGNIKITGPGNGLIFPDGSVMSSAATGVGGGTITGVTAGTGLTGGGSSGGVTLAANFSTPGGDNGSATTVARGDHTHNSLYLPLAGGTLTGGLTGTTGNFSGIFTVGGRTTSAGLLLPATGPATAGAGMSSHRLDMVASVFDSNTTFGGPQTFRWEVAPLGNNTPNPSGSLNLLFGGANPTTNLLSILGSGNVGIGTSAPANKLSVAGTIESTTGGFRFPDGTTQTTASTGGGGDVTDVLQGTGITVTNSAGPQPTVSLNTGFTDGRYLQLGGGILTGPLTGTTATFTSLSGNGSGLTNVTASGLAAGPYANAYTFSNAANNFTGTHSGNGAGLSNVNAATLGGILPSVFARTDIGNLFVGSQNFASNTLFIDSAGSRVGIGTASPSGALLHLNSNGASIIKLGNNSLNQAVSGAVDFVEDSATNFGVNALGFRLTYAGDVNDRFLVQYANGAGASTAITVARSNGNVGIGTQSPATTLDVAGNANIQGSITGAIMWAVIDSNGATVRGSGTTSSAGFGGGSFEVIFNRNVTNCAYIGTIGLPGSSGSTGGEIGVVGRGGNPNGVFVSTFNTAGVATALGFHLMVIC